MPTRGFRLVIAALPALAVMVAALVAVMVAGGFAPVRAEEAYQADPKLVEAAQKEGQVVLYTTLIVDQVVRPMIKAFRSQISGIDVRFVRADSPQQVVKLINQLLVGVHTAAVAEAAVFGAKLGADPRVVLEVIGSSFGGSTMMTRNLPRFISRDFGPATSVTLLLKDLGLIHDEAKAANVPLLLGAVAEQRFLEARARGMGENDMASLVRLWEEPAGVTVDKPRS